MKLKLNYSWNEYKEPATPWCGVVQVLEDGTHRYVCGDNGTTWAEAKSNALAKAKKLMNSTPDPAPPDEEIEI